MECVEVAQKGTIKVDEDPSQIMFLIESTGALPVEDIVLEATEKLKGITENFIESFQIALDETENDPSKMKKVSTFERISLDDQE
jgi:hypothetical protein